MKILTVFICSIVGNHFSSCIYLQSKYLARKQHTQLYSLGKTWDQLLPPPPPARCLGAEIEARIAKDIGHLDFVSPISYRTNLAIGAAHGCLRFDRAAASASIRNLIQRDKLRLGAHDFILEQDLIADPSHWPPEEPISPGEDGGAVLIQYRGREAGTREIVRPLWLGRPEGEKGGWKTSHGSQVMCYFEINRYGPSEQMWSSQPMRSTCAKRI